MFHAHGSACPDLRDESLRHRPDAPVVGHAHRVAFPERRHEEEPQTLHIRRQLHGGADDSTTQRVGTEVRVVMSDMHLVTLPGDDKRLG
jgi:hypothetical protein